jgi:hypothetical protein
MDSGDTQKSKKKEEHHHRHHRPKERKSDGYANSERKPAEAKRYSKRERKSTSTRTDCSNKNATPHPTGIGGNSDTERGG